MEKYFSIDQDVQSIAYQYQNRLAIDLRVFLNLYIVRRSRDYSLIATPLQHSAGHLPNTCIYIQ